jgi:hypothetical protein
MADYLRTAIDNYGTASHRVVLFLNSAGARSTRATTSFTSLTRSNQRTGLSPRCCTASCAPPCAYPSSSKAIRIGPCPSLSARTSGNPAAISSEQRPASSCIRCRKDTERASRTMTRNIDQVEVNGWNTEHIRSITCYCTNPRAYVPLRRSAIEPHRHSRLEGAHVALRLEAQAQRAAVVIVDRTLGLPRRK